MPHKQYEVEAIVRDMVDPKSNKRLWEVKWKGYPSSENTLQQRDTLCHLLSFKTYEKSKSEHKRMKQSLLEHTESAQCTMDLISILNHVNINDIKQLIHEQIDNLSNKSIKSAYFNALPINQILSADIMQYILSFGDLNANRTINKEWNEYLIQNEKICISKRYQSDHDQKMDNDSIFADIQGLESKMSRDLRELRQKYEEEKEQIKASYKQQIEKLKVLSTRECAHCDNVGDIELEKCAECGDNVCSEKCLVYCASDGCETTEQYCYECCLWQSCADEDCSTQFCSTCFPYYDRCEHCQQMFCEKCIGIYRKIESDDRFAGGQSDEDDIDIHVLLCKSCKEDADIETTKYV